MQSIIVFLVKKPVFLPFQMGFRCKSSIIQILLVIFLKTLRYFQVYQNISSENEFLVKQSRISYKNQRKIPKPHLLCCSFGIRNTCRHSDMHAGIPYTHRHPAAKSPHPCSLPGCTLATALCISINARVRTRHCPLHLLKHPASRYETDKAQIFRLFCI